MDIGSSRRKRIRPVQPLEIKMPEKNEPPVKVSDLLSFFSAIVALSAGAIFYVSGWVYEANWHSFYGIQLSQVSLSTQQIMVNGLPGMVVLVFSAIFSVTVIAVVRSFQKESISSDNLPLFAMVTYMLVSVILIILILRLILLGLPIPGEAIISGLTIPIMALIMLVVFQLTNMARVVLDKGLSYIPDMPFFSPELIAVPLFTAVAKAAMNYARSLLLDLVEDQRLRILRSLTETWKFWLSFVLLTAFFISVAISAIMGILNAHSGSRMMGNWRVSPLYLYSDVLIEPLPVAIAGQAFSHGPLSLLTITSDNLYFVDWNPQREYQWHPPLYVVPRSDKQTLVFRDPTPTLPPQASTPIVFTPAPDTTPTIVSQP